ncbi:hypothetical protein DIPPA_07637 [Diplonema papillatum]|nr:hypothetical protein DIPPA_07637 [Diplonema papillatum]
MARIVRPSEWPLSNAASASDSGGARSTPAPAMSVRGNHSVRDPGRFFTARIVPPSQPSFCTPQPTKHR